MFSSCCRCVNKKALKEQNSENENEIDDDEKPKSSLSPTRGGGDTAHTASDDDDGYSSRNELDTTLKVIIEENDNNRDEGDESNANDDLQDKSSINSTGKSDNVKNITEQVSTDGENESVGAIVNNACNISDEEKQKILSKQQTSSTTDNEDDVVGVQINTEEVQMEVTSNKSNDVKDEKVIEVVENDEKNLGFNEVKVENQTVSTPDEVNEDKSDSQKSLGSQKETPPSQKIPDVFKYDACTVEVVEKTNRSFVVEGATGYQKSELTSEDNSENSNNTVKELEIDEIVLRLESVDSCASNPTIEEYISLYPQHKISDVSLPGASSLNVEPCHAHPNSFETSDTLDDADEIYEPKEYVIVFDDNEVDRKDLQRRNSCLSRGGSRSSMKKRVNYNDNEEVIPIPSVDPPPSQPAEDDDEVFSDSVPPMLPRGDMCAPFVTKRGSIPGLAALPDWFREENRELGGILEPPTTPIGRDEVAMRRHRFFSDLINAAQAAAEHRVCFDPLGPFVTEVVPTEVLAQTPGKDCDPSLKSSATTELESLIVRLERLVDRLERTVSARELEYTNQLLQSAQSLVQKQQQNPLLTQQQVHHPHGILQRGATIEEDTLKSLSNQNSISDALDRSTNDLPLVLPDVIGDDQQSHKSSFSPPSSQLDALDDRLKQRITKLEHSVNQINRTDDDLLQQIPTVVESNMSVYAYQDIMAGPLAQFFTLSAKIGGDVAAQADFVKKAFDAQLQFVTLATESAKPSDSELPGLLSATSEQIQNIQTYREKHRTSSFFNHLSAISESIPALGWVCVSPTPGPHVKEMNDAGQFYTNRVLKEWKEKNQTHVEWCRAWIQTLTELQAYIKQYHTTGLVWSGKGKASARAGVPPPPPGPMPPPPPPIGALGDLSISNGGAAGGDDRNALFAQINQGENITKSLKKVTSEMQTHKNPNLRSGPAPYKAPQPFKSSSGSGPTPYSAPVADKPPTFNRDGKKWIIEYHKDNRNLLVENAEMNNVVYMYKCVNSTLQIKGKVNSVTLDSCKKCSVVFDSLVSSVEFVNCQSVQMQVLGKVPTISIDKTDGCQMYLSKDSLEVEIISSKSSEMNVMIPQANGDYVEQPVPEQFKTTIKGTTLATTFVESLG